jgi:hypothetical protein
MFAYLEAKLVIVMILKRVDVRLSSSYHLSTEVAITLRYVTTLFPPPSLILLIHKSKSRD